MIFIAKVQKYRVILTFTESKNCHSDILRALLRTLQTSLTISTNLFTSYLFHKITCPNCLSYNGRLRWRQNNVVMENKNISHGSKFNYWNKMNIFFSKKIVVTMSTEDKEKQNKINKRKNRFLTCLLKE